MDSCPACSNEIIAGSETCENCGYDLTHLSSPRALTPVDKSLHKEPVGALRKHDPVKVPPDRSIQDVIASMVLHRDGCAVVVNEREEPIGIFSERDLLLKIAGLGDELLNRPVSEFMTADPVVIDATAPIAYALHQMDLGGYRHLPVIEKGRAVGMVSVRDIVTFIGDRFLSSSDNDD